MWWGKDFQSEIAGATWVTQGLELVAMLCELRTVACGGEEGAVLAGKNPSW